jgi:hypothetical protein
MFQEKLNNLRPYITGLRFVKNMPVVDLILREGWDMFESDNILYKLSTNNVNYFIVYPKNPEDSIDNILTHVENVIKYNIDKENKLQLLKVKIEELKMLFNDKSLKDLEKLKFIFEKVKEPTLEDVYVEKPHKNTKKYNGVELPPKKNNQKVEMKEEV